MKLKQRWNERHRSEDTRFHFGSFQVYFIDYAITVVPFFLLFIPLHPAPPLPPACPLLTPQFMSMGFTYKFFGFSISYTILTLPLSILYLPIMLLNPCTFSSIAPVLLPADNPPCGLHFYDSVPILVVCLVCFIFLDSVFESCEFAAILLFIVLIFFLFLNKSL